jgi:hypothetical protein
MCVSIPLIGCPYTYAVSESFDACFAKKQALKLIFEEALGTFGRCRVSLI